MPHIFVFRLVCRLAAYVCVFAFSLCAVQIAFAGMAAPQSVVFYPNSALLTVEERVTPQDLPGGGKGVILTLPMRANIASFMLTLSSGQVAGISWKEELVAEQRNTGDAASPRSLALQELADARLQQDSIKAAVAVGKKRIALLSKGNEYVGKEKGVDEVERLDALMDRQLTKLMAELPALERRAVELDVLIQQARERLEELGGEVVRERKAIVAIEGATAPVLARYSYMQSGCGWTPSYTVEALPEKKQAQVTQEAVLWQNSGIIWENALVSVATNTPDLRPIPGRLPAWNMRAGQLSPPAPAQRAAMENTLLQSEVAASKDAAKMVAATSDAPVREEKANFAVWNIGRRSILPASRSRLILSKEQWKADFYYTLRPMLDKRGFLTAAATPPVPVDMPEGPVRFMVDGVVIGSSTMGMYGNLLKLYFGPDPLVTAVMRSDQRQSGEAGLIAKDQTVLWSWNITVKNERTKDVAAQVEDPSPVSENAAIKLEVVSSPKPELNNNAYTWNMSLKAGESRVITHSVKASVPKDMMFSPGR